MVCTVTVGLSILLTVDSSSASRQERGPTAVSLVRVVPGSLIVVKYLVAAEMLSSYVLD
jgi:hypothetical protein